MSLQSSVVTFILLVTNLQVLHVSVCVLCFTRVLWSCNVCRAVAMVVFYRLRCTWLGEDSSGADKDTRQSAIEVSHDHDHATRSACGLVRLRRRRRHTRMPQSQFTTDTCKYSTGSTIEVNCVPIQPIIYKYAFSTEPSIGNGHFLNSKNNHVLRSWYLNLVRIKCRVTE